MRAEFNDNNFSDVVSLLAPVNDTFDSTANDSDKSWVVPNNEQWKLNSVFVTLATTATAGNRVLTIEVQDELSNVIFALAAGAVQAASGTVKYSFAIGAPRETTAVNGYLLVNCPRDLWLSAGYTLRVYDSAAVDAAADDMTVSFQVSKFTV